MKTASLMELLRKRYEPPAWELLEQVANGTGARRDTRYADAVAMGLWPSRGLHLHGFELKVSRGDFLREMKNPAKADAIASRCHFWWIVAAEEKIAPPQELPPSWGLLVPEGSSLVVRKQAVLSEPEPLSFDFLAALIRALGKADADALSGRLSEAMAAERILHAEHMESMKQEHQQQVEAAIASLRASIEEFHRTSGINIREPYPWMLGKVGAVVKLLVEEGVDAQREKLRGAVAQLQQVSQRAQQALVQLERAEGHHGQAAPEGTSHEAEHGGGACRALEPTQDGGGAKAG